MFIIILFFFFFSVHGEDCADTGWEKVEGVMPENYTRGNVLYSGSNSDGIVNICFDRYEIIYLIYTHVHDVWIFFDITIEEVGRLYLSRVGSYKKKYL